MLSRKQINGLRRLLGNELNDTELTQLGINIARFVALKELQKVRKAVLK